MDENIILFKFDNFYYLKANNGTNQIAARIYGVDAIEWDLLEFDGIDFSDHSDEF